MIEHFTYACKKAADYSCAVLQHPIAKVFPRIETAKKVSQALSLILNYAIENERVGERGKNILGSCSRAVDSKTFEKILKIAVTYFGLFEGGSRVAKGLFSLMMFDVSKGARNLLTGTTLCVMGFSELLSLYDDAMYMCSIREQKEGFKESLKT